MEKAIISLIAAAIVGGTFYFFGLGGLIAGVLVILAYEVGYKHGSGKWSKPYH